MTVAELITRLQKMPQDYEVKFYVSWKGIHFVEINEYKKTVELH